MTAGIEIASEAEEFFRSRRLNNGRTRARVLALTYSFNLSAFEHAFENILRWPVTVDVIAGQADKSHRSRESSSRCRLWRARWKGTFHPKLLLLMSKDEVAVGLGSGNMTPDGLGQNLDVWRYFYRTDVGVLAGVRRFLTTALDRAIIPPEVNAQEFVEALPRGGTKPLPVLSTLNGRLLDQVIHRLSKNAKTLDIISPVEGNPAPVIAELKAKLGGSLKCHLFTNEPAPEIAGIATYRKLTRPRPNAEKGANRLRILANVHAKVFAFGSAAYVDVFWGSANLSQAAWQAQGSVRNVDLLVHSRVSSKQWKKMRDGLPPEHTWSPAKPSRHLEKEPRTIEGFQLLHATISKGIVKVAATEPKQILIDFRTAHGKTRCDMNFANDSAEVHALLPQNGISALGLLTPPAPRFIEAKLPDSGWESIPLNDMDSIPDDIEARELEDLLLWEYAGQSFKRKNTVTTPAPARSDRKTSLDEEELAKFFHQGSLDEFVLKWRVIANRIGRSCGSERKLGEVRRLDTLKRIAQDATANPKKWPPYKIDFVEKLLERSCPASSK